MAFWYFEVKNCQIIGREDDFLRRSSLVIGWLSNAVIIR